MGACSGSLAGGWGTRTARAGWAAWGPRPAGRRWVCQPRPAGAAGEQEGKNSVGPEARVVAAAAEGPAAARMVGPAGEAALMGAGSPLQTPDSQASFGPRQTSRRTLRAEVAAVVVAAAVAGRAFWTNLPCLRLWAWPKHPGKRPREPGDPPHNVAAVLRSQRAKTCQNVLRAARPGNCIPANLQLLGSSPSEAPDCENPSRWRQAGRGKKQPG